MSQSDDGRELMMRALGWRPTFEEEAAERVPAQSSGSMGGLPVMAQFVQQLVAARLLRQAEQWLWQQQQIEAQGAKQVAAIIRALDTGERLQEEDIHGKQEDGRDSALFTDLVSLAQEFEAVDRELAHAGTPTPHLRTRPGPQKPLRPALQPMWHLRGTPREVQILAVPEQYPFQVVLFFKEMGKTRLINGEVSPIGPLDTPQEALFFDELRTATVWLLPQKERKWHQTQVKDNGAFTFAEVPPGDYTFEMSWQEGSAAGAGGDAPKRRFLEVLDVRIPAPGSTP